MQKWTIVKWVVSLSLLLFASFFVVMGFTESAAREAIKWSARISFSLFCAAFAASSLHHLLQNHFSKWLLSNRRYIGIAFALVHLIHLAFLGLLQYAFHPVFDLAASTSLAGGGMAYIFVVLMLLTSFPAFAQYLSGRQWAILHTIGGYWIWAIFMTSYSKRAITEYEHIPLVVILILVIALRLRYLLKKKKPLGY